MKTPCLSMNGKGSGLWLMVLAAMATVKKQQRHCRRACRELRQSDSIEKCLADIKTRLLQANGLAEVSGRGNPRHDCRGSTPL